MPVMAKEVVVALVVVAVSVVSPPTKVVEAAVQIFCEARLRLAVREPPRDAGEPDTVSVPPLERPIVENCN